MAAAKRKAEEAAAAKISALSNELQQSKAAAAQAQAALQAASQAAAEAEAKVTDLTAKKSDAFNKYNNLVRKAQVCAWACGRCWPAAAQQLRAALSLASSCVALPRCWGLSCFHHRLSLGGSNAHGKSGACVMTSHPGLWHIF